MPTDFTKRKFQTLPIAKQHKKCAEALRKAIQGILDGHDHALASSGYNDMAEWLSDDPLNYPPPFQHDHLKSLYDRYHAHLERAFIKHKEHNLLPLIRRGDRSSGEDPWPIAICLDHLRSAHNVGSILRTVEAFSLGKVYFSERTPFVTNKQVIDASMGASQWVECHQGISFETLPRPLIALETSDKAVSIYDFAFPDSFSLIVGNEEYGCSDAALKNSDFIIEIPLRGRKNSLNVANAFAITAAEIYRQRKSLS